MPPEDRFDRLESEDKPLPAKVKAAVSKLDRFGHLEIGDIKAERPAPAIRTPSPASNRSLCSHCGQTNEATRDICWACFKPFKEQGPPKPEPSQEIQLILDGQTYRSGAADVPEDVRALMDRIREEGYSDALLQEWRQWRAARRAKGRSDEAAHDVKAFQGQRVSVIRIDGKLYQSDDPNLQPEIRELFDYVDKNGVTPDLLEHLRRNGEMVRFRPHTTPQPSDGDIDFWRAVGDRLLTPPSMRRLGLRVPFRQQLIVLAISVGVPAVVILWVWGRYFNTIGRMIGR